ncbi:MAG: glycerophosphodiester phosphodiesterase [Bdellovibrionota bacterium]|nr:glycerophosphodiester phosphodiesterase [Bdellovibrionota bacterium]
MKYILLMLLGLNCNNASAFDVIAHRGLPRLYPEHSLQGLQEALKLKPDYVEPDVVLSKDNVAIILHDTHLDTTTNVARVFPKRKREDGRYYAADFTLKELKQLNINHRIDLKTKKAVFPTRPLLKESKLTIPTLDQFLDALSRYNQKHSTKIGAYPEIKAPEFHLSENKDIVKIVHDQLLDFHKKDPNTPIILQCFDSKTLKRIKKEMNSPFFLVQLVAENSWGESSTDYDKLKTGEGLKEMRKYVDGLGPWIPQLVTKAGKPSEFLKYAKKLNFKIHPYTLRNDALPPGIKTEKELLVLLKDKLKVDGVFTDNINTSIPLLKEL